MNHYKTEIDRINDRLFLSIEASLTPEDEKELTKEGWVFLNNGIALSDGTPAFYFYKKDLKESTLIF